MSTIALEGAAEGVVIRPLRIDDDAEIHTMYEAMREAMLHGNPERPMWSEEVLLGMLRSPDDDIELHVLVAVDDDAQDGPAGLVHGSGFLVLPKNDNKQMAFMGAAVQTTSARRGIGGALVERLADLAGALGRSQLLSDAVYQFEDRESHGYRRFAEAHGFRVATYQVRRRLDLPVPEDRLQAWIDHAAPHHEGYLIETYTEIPDELLPSVCDVENTLAVDAPSGDIEFEAQSRTPEVRKQARERDRNSGVTVFETVAVDANGRAVAVTTLEVAEGEGGHVRQGGTVVHRDHRGHRLGLAVKAANLRAMQRAFPERTAVHTANDEANANMVAINEQLGFEPMELHVQFLRVAEPPA